MKGTVDSGHEPAQLDLDVLRTIVPFCRLPDLLSISQSSHSLRHVALSGILARPLHLRGPARIEAFGRFISSGDPALLLLITTLIIENLRTGTPEAVEVVVALLQQATRLRELRLYWGEYAYLTAGARISAAIVSLPDLQCLHFYTGINISHNDVVNVVLGLNVQLKELMLPAESDNALGPSFPNSLAIRQEHLERLTICYPSLKDTQWTPFPHVHTLSLTVADEHFSLARMAEIFPRVKRLSVHARVFFLDLDQPSAEALAEREASIAVQRAGGGWPALDSIEGTIVDLWTLCLTCPVRRVCLGQYDEGHHHAFIDVVSRTRPKIVFLKLYCAEWFPVPVASPSMLLHGTGEDAGAVSHMLCQMMITLEPVSSGTQDVLNNITPLLRTSRLEYVHLAIAEFFRLGPDADDRALQPLNVSPQLEAAIAGLDLPAIVSGIASAGTHLHTIVLSLAERTQSVWSVSRSEGHQMLRRLDAYTGKQVIEREERL